MECTDVKRKRIIGSVPYQFHNKGNQCAPNFCKELLLIEGTRYDELCMNSMYEPQMADQTKERF